jgi:hypothetical protein
MGATEEFGVKEQSERDFPLGDDAALSPGSGVSSAPRVRRLQRPWLR